MLKNCLSKTKTLPELTIESLEFHYGSTILQSFPFRLLRKLFNINLNWKLHFWINFMIKFERLQNFGSDFMGMNFSFQTQEKLRWKIRNNCLGSYENIIFLQRIYYCFSTIAALVLMTKQLQTKKMVTILNR